MLSSVLCLKKLILPLLVQSLVEGILDFLGLLYRRR
jgi:hypothetical protein